MIAAAIFLVFPLCLAFAAFTDLFTMTIPNRIPAILLGAFIIVAPLAGMEWQTIGMSLLAGLAVFAVCFSLFAINVMGGGDAKLLTAAAVWYGFTPVLLEFLLSVALFGGVVTIVILLLRSRANSVLAMGLPVPHSLTTAKKIPYGIAIGIAGLLTYAQAPLVQMAIASAG